LCWPAVARCCATSTFLLREETGLPVKLADDPLTAVVMGAAKVLDELSLRDVTVD
jgi:rod shape-determining protein MreB and related proteins